MDFASESSTPTTRRSIVELVSIQPPTLLGTEFDRAQLPPLAAARVTPEFAQGDIGTNVSLDVTSLMVEAQRRGLLDFQIRVMEDLGPAIPVLMEIDDDTGSDRALYAPLLTVTYF